MGHFYAVYQIGNDGIMRVFSTRRHGRWERDEMFSPIDLDMPEYEYNEWDILRIEKDEAPPLTQPGGNVVGVVAPR